MVHPSRFRLTRNDARFAVITELLENRHAILPLWRHLTHAYFVADHFYGLLALYNSTKNKTKHKKTFLRTLCGTYSGNSPSTLHTYSFWTSRFRIWCSICLAFFGDLPKSKMPLVNLSSRCIVRRFFRLYSLARMKTTVLCLYLPQGCTFGPHRIRNARNEI